MVEETYEPGATVSLVARRHGVAPDQLFTWRRLAAEGVLTATTAGEEVVPASEHRALQQQVRETVVGAPMDLRSAATMASGSGLPSLSIAVTERP
jgi:transposase-like protein